jgi:hypothetical protein
MPDIIQVSKHDEFFLTIAKQEDHTFIMLGVMKEGVPTLFARVGKFADVDASAGNTCLIIGKIVLGGSLSRLVDEGLRRPVGHKCNISYQAYDINYEQVIEFLTLIKGVEEKQLKNPEIREGIIRMYKNTNYTETKIFEEEAMHALVPVQELDEDDQVIFKLKKLSEWDLNPSPLDANQKSRKEHSTSN